MFDNFSPCCCIHKEMNTHYGWWLITRMKRSGWWKCSLVICAQRGGNERKSHKYTNCMLKGLNLKCNITGGEEATRIFCRNEKERTEPRIKESVEEIPVLNLNDRSTAKLSRLGCAYISVIPYYQFFPPLWLEMYAWMVNNCGERLRDFLPTCANKKRHKSTAVKKSAARAVCREEWNCNYIQISISYY